jgi:hypothetical protein
MAVDGRQTFDDVLGGSKDWSGSELCYKYKQGLHRPLELNSVELG